MFEFIRSIFKRTPVDSIDKKETKIIRMRPLYKSNATLGYIRNNVNYNIRLLDSYYKKYPKTRRIENLARYRETLNESTSQTHDEIDKMVAEVIFVKTHNYKRGNRGKMQHIRDKYKLYWSRIYDNLKLVTYIATQEHKD